MSDKQIYRCKRCNQCYERDPQRMIACAVAHPPGSCCHYGERQLSEEEVESRIELTEDSTEVWRRALGL